MFILGAGFSRAISTQMPTLDDLGQRISGPFKSTPSFALLPPAAQAAINAGRLPGGSLEAWLSHLATAAPFLNAPEQLHNSAISRELVELIVDVIEQSEANTLSAPMPYWLRRLVALWDRLGASVITFNYDTLLEQAVNASEMPWIYWENVAAELVDAVAVRPLKMHGSTNWWWQPGDRSIFAIQPAPFAGRWGQPAPALIVPGMERFLVPPLATKADYYDINVTRDAWTSARKLLNGASRIVLVGYSAPLTDLTVGSLLSHFADPQVPVVVVDQRPDEVVARLQKLGLQNAASFQGSDPVRGFAERYEQETSSTVAPSLPQYFDEPAFSPDNPVVARVTAATGTYEVPRLPITEIVSSDDVTAIVASEWQQGEVAQDRAIKAHELRKAIEDAAHDGRSVVLRIPNERERTVLHLGHRNFTRTWLVVQA